MRSTRVLVRRCAVPRQAVTLSVTEGAPTDASVPRGQPHPQEMPAAREADLRKVWRMRDLLDLVVARVAGGLCPAAPEGVPPRLCAPHGRGFRGQTSPDCASTVYTLKVSARSASLEADDAHRATPTGATLPTMLSRYAVLFACTLYGHKLPGAVDAAMLAASGAGGTGEVAGTSAFYAVSQRPRSLVAEATRASGLPLLAASLDAVCRQAREAHSSLTADGMAKLLLTEVDATATAPGSQLRILRRRAAGATVGGPPGCSTKNGPPVSPSSIRNTMDSVLQRTLWQMHLARTLVCGTTGSGNEEGEAAWTAAVGRAMLWHLLHDTIYDFHGGVYRQGKLVDVSHHCCHGLTSLLVLSWEVAMCSDTVRAEPVVHSLHTLVGHTLELLPFILQSASLGEGAVSASVTTVTPTSHPLFDLLEALLALWKRHQRQVRWEGNHLAMHWLPLVPSLTQCLGSVLQRQLQLAVAPEDGRADGEAAALATAQEHASRLLRDLVFYDLEAYEARSRRAGAATTESIAASAGVQVPDDAAPLQSATEGAGAESPLQRKRGKRSLFYKATDSPGTVLREGDGAAASRFLGRRGHVGGAAGDGARRTSAFAAAERESSALFHAMVLSPDMWSWLEATYSLHAGVREQTLERIWLETVHGMRRLQRLVYAPTPSVYEMHSATDVTAAVSGKRKDASKTTTAATSAHPPRDLLSAHVPAVVKSLFEVSNPTRAQQVQQRRVLEVLAAAQSALPLATFDSLLRIAEKLSTSLIRIYNMGGNASAARQPVDAEKRSIEENRRSLSLFLVAGTEELIWGSDALWQAVHATMALRTAPGNSLPANPEWLRAAGRLSSRLALEQTWVGSRLHGRRDEMLVCTQTALASLASATCANEPEGTPAGQTSVAHPKAPLHLLGKQMAAALIVSHLNALSFRVRTAEAAAVSEAAIPVYEELLTVLVGDPELLVVCCTPSFLHAVYETHLRLRTETEMVSNFADHYLFPTAMPMILRCLHKSRQEDTPAGHMRLCEQLLPLLSDLTRFGAALQFSLAEALRTPWSEVLMRVSIYCVRVSGRGGLRRASDFHLSPPSLPEPPPWPLGVEAAIASLLPYITSTPDGDEPPGHRANLLHFLDLSSSCYQQTRLDATFMVRAPGCVEELGHFHDGLRESTSFADIVRADAAQRYAAEEAAVGGDGDGDLAVLVSGRNKAMQQWVAAVGKAQVQAAKHSYALAQADPFHQHILGYLTRFLDYMMREQELILRGVDRGAAAPARSAADAPLPRHVDEMKVLLLGSPLVVLEYIGFLSFTGSWARVCWALNVAETAVRVERRRDSHAIATVRDVAVTAVLALLRAVPPPADGSTLTTILVKSLCSLADMLSRETSTTLLGFDRQDVLTGMMSTPSQDEYRSMIFAIKQVTLYVVLESHKFCASPCPVHDDEGTAGVAAGDTLTEEVDEGSAAALAASTAPTEKEKLPYYEAKKRRADITGEAQRTFNFPYRYHLNCLVSAMDLNFECVRHHALQHGVLDDDLRAVLTASYESLCRTLTQCIVAFLVLRREDREQLYADEYAELLWAGLCAAATAAHVCYLDYAGTFFTSSVLRHTQGVVTAVEQLVMLLPAQPKEASPEGDVPVLSVLIRGISLLTGDSQAAQRLTMRLAVGQPSRTDPTVAIMAFYALATHAAQHPITAPMFHRLWSLLQQQLLVPPEEDMRPEASTTRKPKKRTAPSQPTRLAVPSLTELRLSFDAFREIDSVLAERQRATGSTTSDHSSAEYLGLKWTVDTDRLLASATENPSLLTVVRPGRVVPSGTDVSEEEMAAAAGTTEWSALFVLSHLNVSQSLADGSVPVADLIDSVVLQGMQLLRALGNRAQPRTPDNKPFLLSQLLRLGRDYLQNVLAIFSACPLVEIAQRPNAAQLLLSLTTFGDLLKHTRDDRRMGGGGDHPTPEDVRDLWVLLTRKVQQELIVPQEPAFLEHQSQLLNAIRAHRSLRMGHRGATTDPSVDLFAASLAPTEVLARTALEETTRQGLCAREDGIMVAHDDIRSVQSSGGGPVCEGCLSPPRVEPALPLEVVLAMLKFLQSYHLPPDLRTECGSTDLHTLAQSVVVYTMRAYVLLRPRLDGTVVNLMPAVRQHRCRSVVGRADSFLWRQCRLPASSTHTEDVRNTFFASSMRAAVRAAMRLVGLTNAELSEEELTFEYIRDAALYVHLLGALTAVMIRFQMSGEVDDFSTTAVRRRMYQQQTVLRQQQRRGDSGAHREGPAATSAALISNDEVLKEMHAAAVRRQTTVEGVNANLLETCVLHLVNVGENICRHTDCLTHVAVDREVQESCATSSAEKGCHPRDAACIAYATELRTMVVAVLQGVFSAFVSLTERHPHPAVNRAMQHMVSRAICDGVPWEALETRATAEGGAAATALLRQWRQQRSEWFVGSPTMLEVISPHYLLRGFAGCLHNAPQDTVSTVAACLTAHVRRPDVSLPSLLAATTELISSTLVRTASLHMYCETLCQELLRRDDFALALAPPTVATQQQQGGAAVPNEVLIPFVAAMARQDVHTSKQTLAAFLHTVMTKRGDVFGQPPVASRQSHLSLVRAPSLVGGSFESENPLYAQPPPQSGAVPQTPIPPAPPVVTEEERDIAMLAAFQVEQSDAAALTHRKALGGLNISLPATMEVVLHLKWMQVPSREETKRARGLLIAADNARRERIGAHRAFLHAVESSTGDAQAVLQRGQQGLDASLQVEDPLDFGVALLHLKFALTKIIHASYRRHSQHQGPRALADMTESLLDVCDTRRPNDAAPNDPGRQSQLTSAKPSEVVTRRDPMMAGTLRLLVARSVLCAQAVGYAPTGAVLQGRGPQRGRLLPALFAAPPPGEGDGGARTDEQLACQTKREGGTAEVVHTTTTVHSPQARARIRRALRMLRYEPPWQRSGRPTVAGCSPSSRGPSGRSPHPSPTASRGSRCNQSAVSRARRSGVP